MILYEYPFNERVRTYLRLEHLFRRLSDLIGRDSALDHHFAIQTIFDIMDVSSRADMKSDILKDIDKQRTLLGAYRGNPAISEQALDEVLAQLDTHYTAVNTSNGKLGQALSDNEWLMSVRSRVGIPAGTCEFDLPGYFHWQHQPAGQRQADLHRWVQTLVSLAEAISLLLKMMRDSGSPHKVIALGGQFQQNLPQGRTYQLLRVSIDPFQALVPEISANRLMLSIRLMQPKEDDGRLQSFTEDASFELTLCT